MAIGGQNFLVGDIRGWVKLGGCTFMNCKLSYCLSQFLPHLLSFWLWIKRDCKWYAVGWPPDCHIWLRNVSVHVSHACLFLASPFAVTFAHARGTQWLHGSQTVCHKQQTCANQTHSSVFPFSFSQPLFSFFAFSRLGGFLYQLWDTPTREKSQTIKAHWERQVEQGMRTWTSDSDLSCFDWNQSRQGFCLLSP